MRIIRSNRKSLCIEITRDAEVLVRAPYCVSDKRINELIKEKSSLIEEQIEKVKARTEKRFTADEIDALADSALEAIPKRVAHFAPIVGVDYGNITIRNQRSRWGSCSTEGNLNFNCLLMLTPPEVLDYVVVHELCHRKEMNHSPRFWSAVAQVLPDCATPKKWLRDNGSALIARI